MSYHLLVLSQHQVVVAQSHAEDDGGDSFKAMDPFLPLGSLSTHIKHSAESKTHTVKLLSTQTKCPLMSTLNHHPLTY